MNTFFFAFFIEITDMISFFFFLPVLLPFPLPHPPGVMRIFFILLQLVICSSAELIFNSTAPRRCKGGIGSNALTGCVGWSEIGIQGLGKIPKEITLSPIREDSEDELVKCKIKASNYAITWCKINKPQIESSSKYVILADGVAIIPKLTVELQPAPMIKSLLHDSDLCSVIASTGPSVVACEKDALIIIKGKSLADTKQVLLQSPSCSENVECHIQHVTKARIACTISTVSDAIAKCSTQQYPLMQISLSTPTVSSMDVGGDNGLITLISSPEIISLEYNKGCTSGYGTKHLYGCRDGAEIEIRGLSLHHSNDTVIVMNSRQTSVKRSFADCKVVSATFSHIKCILTAEQEGRYQLYIVALGGRSQAAATISVAPFPSLSNITYDQGCLTGNGSLELVCGNKIKLVFNGAGLVTDTELLFSDNRCKCVEGGIITASDTSFDQPISMSSSYGCLLVCENDSTSSALSLRVAISLRSGGANTKEVGSISVMLPPLVTNVTFVDSGDGAVCQTPDQITPPIVLENCTNKAVLVISGANLIANHTVIHLFAVDDVGVPVSEGLQPTVACRTLGTQSIKQTNITVGTGIEQFVSEQHRCQLEFMSLPVANCSSYVVVASSIGGFSVIPVNYELPVQSQSTRTDVYQTLLHAKGGSPVVTLLPQPVIRKIENCLQQREDTLLEICTVIDYNTITVVGEGFLPETTVTLRPASESDGKERSCVVTSLLENRISCRTKADADPLQTSKAYDIIVSSRGGVAAAGNSLILIPRPRINGISGCAVTATQNSTTKCKHGDRLALQGAGFTPENTTLELIPLSGTDLSATPNKFVSLALVQSTEIVIEASQGDQRGVFDLWLHTRGGSLSAGKIELLPMPTLTKVRNINCIKTAKRAASCPRGGVIEIHGTNFDDVKAVTFQQPLLDNQTQSARPPCNIMNVTNNVIICKASHTVEYGAFFPIIETSGGETRWDPQLHRHSTVELIPLPVITGLYYYKAGHCLEGNGTKELSGCKSGTAILIKGKHLDEQGVQVLLLPGTAGGRNGPPECWIISVTDTSVSCVLDHTSAAGAFDVTIRHVHGDSETLRVAVIPGNLYLLFKNTKIVLAISNIVGWICACVWTGSLATLAVSNELASSTAGIAPDMVLYNALGLLCWTCYSIYFYIHSELGVPVFVQDIVYSISSYVVVIVFLFQIYRFGSTGITTFAKLYCFALLSFLAKAALENVISDGAGNAQFVSQLARIHLACALIKYIPQVHYNYSRKSTEGYSITAVWLDFTGAVLLLLQMFFDGIIRHKWSLMITLNIPKFVLCFEVILFNLIYAFQHYVLYGVRIIPVEDTAEKQLDEKPLCITISDVMPFKRRNQT